MPLQWSEVREPNNDCSYDHVVAETPLGSISIEWKSWKDYPGYTSSLPWGAFVTANSLDEAKRLVQSAWDEIAKQVVALSSAG